ncbi:MAG TPA: TolC family protein [Bacteroidales bacterium]|nr:TolC family protein [Bacteroidales bacterium]
MPGKIENIIRCRKYKVIIVFLFTSVFLNGQAPNQEIPAEFTLSDCISFALENQPVIRQSVIDEKITGKNIGIALSDWYPQASLNAGVQHYLVIPENSSGAKTTSANTSAANFSVTQAIYSNKLLLDTRSSGELRNQAAESTESAMIDTYVNVTKAFYNVLLTRERIRVLDEAISRLQRNYDDAYNLYRNGMADRIDYQRTEIARGNARAQKKSAGESLTSGYSILKQVMGMSAENNFTVSYDTSAYEKEILTDTTKIIDYTRRVEYRQVESALKLQSYNIGYYRWSFLPSVSAFYNYNSQFYNDRFPDLYTSSYPSSAAGLNFSLPLFEGMNRVQNLGKAKLQYKRLQIGMEGLKNEMSTEYISALSQYSGDLNELKTAKMNIALARDIFNTVRLQYEKGIKAYLEVIVSETDLRTAELNYLNSLFRVLSSKVDLEKAAGDIKVN